jgi:hypothetical protein
MKDNLNTMQIATKYVTLLLRKEKKENHFNTCQDRHERLEGGLEFLLKITIHEEMQHYKYRVHQSIGQLYNTVFFMVQQHWGGCCYCHFAANFKGF